MIGRLKTDQAKETEFDRIMESFIASIPETIGAFLIDIDGNMICSAWDNNPYSTNPIVRGLADFDLQKNESLFAFNIALTMLLLEKNTRRDTSSRLNSLYIETKKSKIFSYMCGSSAIFVAIFNSDTKLGLTILNIHQSIKKLEALIPDIPKKNITEKLDQLELNLRKSFEAIQRSSPVQPMLQGKIFVVYPPAEFERLSIQLIMNQLINDNPGLEIHYYHDKKKKNHEDTHSDSLSYFLDNLEWCDIFIWIHTKTSRPIEYKIAQALRKNVLIVSTAIENLPKYATIKCAIDWKQDLTTLCKEIEAGLKNLVSESEKQ